MEDFSDDHLIIIKGHRTKRPRPPSSPVSHRSVSGEGSSLMILPSFTTMTSDDDDDDDDDHHSNETTESTVEDEIMANCLMYLAQSGGGGAAGRGGCVRHDEELVKISANKRLNQVVSDDSTTEMKGGLFVYSCKTCNKNFPSFQALGGHRASHKRPKNTVQEGNKPIFTPSIHDDDEDEDKGICGKKFRRLSEDDNNISPKFITNKFITVGNHKAKIHECSFCGSEFSSGQALGGHMRRHRNTSNPTTANAKVIAIGVQTEKRTFQLDLNLPAPEDDHHHHHHHYQGDMNMNMKLQFNKASAASALVGCHY